MFNVFVFVFLRGGGGVFMSSHKEVMVKCLPRFIKNRPVFPIKNVEAYVKLIRRNSDEKSHY